MKSDRTGAAAETENATAKAATSCTAFLGFRRVASGERQEVALAAKRAIEAEPGAPLLVFQDATGERVELDLRGTDEEIIGRLGRMSGEVGALAGGPTNTPDTVAHPGPGRPKLGVVAREVTLLPRHWDWLNAQPGGASVALRKLVEEARRASAGKDRIRQTREVAYRFMSAMAGDLPGFEEAARALFAGDRGRFDAQTENWPADVRDYARERAAETWEGGTE